MSRCRIAREIVVLLIGQHDKFRMRDILRQDFSEDMRWLMAAPGSPSRSPTMMSVGTRISFSLALVSWLWRAKTWRR